MLFKILPATQADLPFMREMLYQSIFVDPPPPRSILDESAFKHYVEGWGRPHDAGFVAESATGDALGATWIRLFTRDDPGFGYVDDDTPEVSTLAVTLEWRGRGLGTALMHALLQYADERYERVSLSCDPNNPAMNLYRRLGFVYHSVNGGSHTLVRWRHDDHAGR